MRRRISYIRAKVRVSVDQRLPPRGTERWTWIRGFQGLSALFCPTL